MKRSIDEANCPPEGAGPQHLWLANQNGPELSSVQKTAGYELLDAEASAHRSFIGDPGGCKRFFSQLHDPGTAIAASYWFPYRPGWVFHANVDGGSLQYEQDYWLKDGAGGGYVVLHVHFGGTWELPDLEMVTAVNMRHAEGHEKAGHTASGQLPPTLQSRLTGCCREEGQVPRFQAATSRSRNRASRATSYSKEYGTDSRALALARLSR